MDKLFYLFVISTLSIFLFFITNLGLSVNSSPNADFNVTPSSVFLNWTNSYNATLTIGTNNFTQTIEVVNSTNIPGNYSQPSTGSDPSPCQIVGNVYNIQLNALDQNTTVSVYNTSTSDLTLSNTFFRCKPGRYYINSYSIRNATQNGDSANISVTIDVPITDVISPGKNPFDVTTGIGNFSGSFSGNNAYNHSYYFNISKILNATGVAINMSGWTSSQDVDVFLFDDSGKLKGKSINKTAADEYILFNYLPSDNTMWEIRAFGNSTSSISYKGNLYFTTLNATNSSLITVDSLNFELANVGDSFSKDIILKNEGSIPLKDIKETMEIYLLKNFTGSTDKNFTFVVPDSSIVSKVKVSLNWTGSANYTLNLYNQSDMLVATSTNKNVFANRTGTTQEEYNETSSIPLTAGVWKAEVKSSSIATNIYNVTAKIVVDNSKWLSSNFSSTSLTNLNDNTTVQINLTVPNNTMSGIYQGFVRYLDERKAGLEIPITVNITTPVLLVDNTMNSESVRIDENVNFTYTKTLTFVVNNTGFYDLGVSITNSSPVLTCASSGCSGYTAPISFNTFSTVGNLSSQTLTVNVAFNGSMPSGVYDGWIFINGTNTPSNLNAHPYPTFNLTLRLNLISTIGVTIPEVKTVDGNDVVEDNTNPGNISLKMNITFINGTELSPSNSDVDSFTTSNFTVWLQEGNTSKRVPSNGGLNISNGTNPIYCIGGCPGGNNFFYVNASVPANLPGGIYKVLSTVTYLRFLTSYSGDGLNNSIIINQTGAMMSSNITGCSFTSSSCSVSMTVDNGTETPIYVNITNFGPTSSSITVNFSENCVGYDIDVGSATGCGYSTSGRTFTLSPNPFSNTCIISWNITTPSTGSASSCTGYIQGRSVEKWYNPDGINLTIKVSNGTVSTTTTTSPGASAGLDEGSTTTTTLPPTTRYLNIISSANLVNITQGKEGSINFVVKNIHETEFQDINLSVGTINSTWIKQLSPTTAELGPNENVSVSIKFAIPNNTETKDYLAVFKAKSQLGNATKSFTIRVLPSEETKSNITATFDQLKKDFLSLWTDLNNTIASGKNVTEAQTWFNQLKAKMNQTEKSINASDYFTAYQLFGDIRDLMNKTKIALGLKGAGFQLSLTMIIIIAVAAVVGGGFLAYLFWPTKMAGAKVVKQEGKIEEKKTEEKVTVQLSKSDTDSWKKLRDKYEKFMKRK
jgi:hypothetical protein